MTIEAGVAGTSGEAGKACPKEQGCLKEQGPRLPSEQRLWLAVLRQAITDATLDDASLIGYSLKNQRALLSARRAARAWLCQRSFDLDTVCDGAGLNPEKILRQARELRAQGWH